MTLFHSLNIFSLLSIRWQVEEINDILDFQETSTIEISVHEICYFLLFLVMSAKYFADIWMNRIPVEIIFNRLFLITS